VETFRKELDGFKFREATTDEYFTAFAALAAALEAPGVAHDCPSPPALIRVLQLARPEACFTGSGAPRKLQAKGKWDAAARPPERRKQRAKARRTSASGCYERCHARTTRSRRGGRRSTRLPRGLDGLSDGEVA
jgi:hypothetical protein